MFKRDRIIRRTHLYKPPLYVPRRVASARVDIGPKCRFLDLNLSADCAKLLLESGIRDAGIDRLRDKFLAGTDRADDHLVYFVIEGSITALSQHYKKRLKKGDLLIARVDRGLWLQIKRGESCHGVWFHISDVERWRSIENANLLVRPALDPASMDFAMERLIMESLSGSDDTTLVGSHYAAIVLLYLDRELADIVDPQARLIRHKLFRMWDRIGKSLHEDWPVSRMAAELNVSAGYLHRVVHEYHAVTPMDMLRRMRVDRAKRLLAETSMTLDAIAGELGYSTAYSLSNAFLATFGLRPGSYRKGALRKK